MIAGKNGEDTVQAEELVKEKREGYKASTCLQRKDIEKGLFSEPRRKSAAAMSIGVGAESGGEAYILWGTAGAGHAEKRVISWWQLVGTIDQTREEKNEMKKTKKREPKAEKKEEKDGCRSNAGIESDKISGYLCRL